MDGEWVLSIDHTTVVLPASLSVEATTQVQDIWQRLFQASNGGSHSFRAAEKLLPHLKMSPEIYRRILFRFTASRTAFKKSAHKV